MFFESYSLRKNDLKDASFKFKVKGRTMSIYQMKVSTKTIIATSNILLEDMSEIYKLLPLENSIKTIYFKNEIRGNEEWSTKAFRRIHKSFRNAINVVMEITDDAAPKRINFKLSKNGKFQMTGCKTEEHAIIAVQTFMSYLLKCCRDHIRVVPIPGKPHSLIRVYFQTVMTNVDSKVNFTIDRQKLDELLHSETMFHSLLETSFGYTGVNIKIPIDKSWMSLPVPIIETTNNENWEKSDGPLDQIIPSHPFTDKQRFNTFLVFHSGNIIMSGMRMETMCTHFDMFMNILNQWKHKIKETIESVYSS